MKFLLVFCFLSELLASFGPDKIRRPHYIESSDSLRHRPSPYWHVPLLRDADPVNLNQLDPVFSQKASESVTEIQRVTTVPTANLRPNQEAKDFRSLVKKRSKWAHRQISDMRQFTFAVDWSAKEFLGIHNHFVSQFKALDIPVESEEKGAFLLPAWSNLLFVSRRIVQSGPGSQIKGIQTGADSKSDWVHLLFHTHKGLAKIKLTKPKPRARVAILVDDVGYHGEGVRRYLKMNMPVTISILPFYDTSAYFAKRSRQLGFEVMLHMPMQASFGSYYKYENLIRPGLKPLDLIERTQNVLKAVPYIQGVNNHEGSKATEDDLTMNLLMSELSRHPYYFVDSVTSQKSVAYKYANRYGIPAARRNFDFLDNDKRTFVIESKLEELIAYALNRPKRIVLSILHEKESTAIAVENTLPEFRRQKIEILSPGDFLLR